MTQQLKREPDLVSQDMVGRFKWLRTSPRSRPIASSSGGTLTEGKIRVDEYHDDGDLVVKAELPGIDPETDVDVSVVDHRLRIAAERRYEEELEDKGYVHNEIGTGSFERILPLPVGVTEAEMTVTYKDGILEIRIPAPQAPETRRIPVKRS